MSAEGLAGISAPHHVKVGSLRCACIDIGSNTTRLLVAEPDGSTLRDLDGVRAFTRIGAACREDGTIPREKIDEVALTVASQKAIASAAGAERLRAVATAAIRRAPNRDELLAAIRERSGVEVEVLSGEDEARLAFLGATGSCPGAVVLDAEGPVAVVDVGGGSTEIVVGTPGGTVDWVVSVPLGSSVLPIERPEPDGVPDPASVAAARAAALQGFDGITPPAVTRAVAVGGSATSLRLLAGETLSPAGLDRALDVLLELPVDAVVERFALHPDRVRMLPAGLVLLGAASGALGGRPLEVGRGGLREGVVLEELERGGWSAAG
ncbi:hypothetical protein C7Y72_13590 [Paraconexibacter algicola]|uniref:Ppx/GppA phosphatase N-terminal domain-containing protein n=1 Tax=Paraconexibacter algicola TaxID=2133960 RepID=A0A2T4UMY2_9ACTN|nr:hypothetical protein C7Y72_13590 [Paraconexibacter algicola]